ncbi:MAG: hypothetical protein R3B06_03920 [Kofleriaceae bacterium]
MTRRPLALVVMMCLVTLGACAHDVHARFPASAGEATGQIELVFTEAAAAVTVVVNGQLVVRGARTERVLVRDVPTGYAEVSVAAGPGEKQVRVWVEPDRQTTVPLGAPGEAPLSALRGVALSLASLALYTLLR